MVDDINKAILVYGNNSSSGDEPGEDSEVGSSNVKKRIDDFIASLSQSRLSEFDQIYSNFYNTNSCTNCHGPNEIPRESKSALRTFFLRGLDLDQEVSGMNMMRRMSEDSVKPMPPTGGAFEERSPQIYKDLKLWLEEAVL